MDSATQKLELGLERLAKAGHDADLLGLALQSIHGALEDHFRARLAADSQMPESQRATMLDPKQVQWKELLDAMQLYGDLSANDRDQIWRTNGLRTKVAHGGRYSGTRVDLERYAALVQSLVGYTPAKVAGPARGGRASAEKPAESRRTAGRQPASTRPADTLDIPRAIRAGRPSARRPRSRWPGGLIALALLVGLALFVAFRGLAQPLARSATAPTAADTTVPEAVTAIAVAPPTALPRSATVTTQDGLNLRKDHASSAQLLASLSNGTRVAIIGGPVLADGHIWWNVEADGWRGWCAGEFLTFDKT
jgi:hypothetical protein